MHLININSMDPLICLWGWILARLLMLETLRGSSKISFIICVKDGLNSSIMNMQHALLSLSHFSQPKVWEILLMDPFIHTWTTSSTDVLLIHIAWPLTEEYIANLVVLVPLNINLKSSLCAELRLVISNLFRNYNYKLRF